MVAQVPVLHHSVLWVRPRGSRRIVGAGLGPRGPEAGRLCFAGDGAGEEEEELKAIPTTSKKHFIFSFSINIEHAEDSTSSS